MRLTMGGKKKTKFGHFKGGDCCWCLVPCMNIHTHTCCCHTSLVVEMTVFVVGRRDDDSDGDEERDDDCCGGSWMKLE